MDYLGRATRPFSVCRTYCFRSLASFGFSRRSERQRDSTLPAETGRYVRRGSVDGTRGDPLYAVEDPQGGGGDLGAARRKSMREVYTEGNTGKKGFVSVSQVAWGMA